MDTLRCTLPVRTGTTRYSLSNGLSHCMATVCFVYTHSVRSNCSTPMLTSARPTRLEAMPSTLLAGNHVIQSRDFYFLLIVHIFFCRHGQVKCVELLLSKGSEVVSDNSGVSTLEICAQVRICEYGIVHLPSSSPSLLPNSLPLPPPSPSFSSPPSPFSLLPPPSPSSLPPHSPPTEQLPRVHPADSPAAP